MNGRSDHSVVPRCDPEIGNNTDERENVETE